MAIDDFFKKIDNKIESINAKKEADAERKIDLESFLRNSIQDIAPSLKEYEEKLKERGVNCELRISDLGFSLIMKFKDGGHHGIIFGRELRSKYQHYTFTSTFTNDDGKNITGTTAMPVTEKNWSKKLVEENIEKTIDDFFLYSDIHGGY